MNLTDLALDIAGSQVGVREHGRNTGPEVDRYLAAVGLAPGNSWCAAFASWVYLTASQRLGIACPLHISGGALHMWEKSPLEQRTQEPEPGAIFVLDHGLGRGHVGIIEHVFPTELVFIAGNTNDGHSREGDGVYRLIHKRSEPWKGAVRFVGYIVPSRSLGAIPTELRA